MNRTLAALLCAFALTGCGGGLTGTTDPDTCGVDACGICPAEQSGVKICSMVSFPDASESVTLVNYGSGAVNLANWTLWDESAWLSNSGQHTFTGADVINARATRTFTSLGFTINDSGETIYLKNNSGVLTDQRSN